MASRPSFESTLRTVLLRELGAVRREIEAYPDETTPWVEVPGLPNSGGNLALHIAGNLRHFVGRILGGIEYVRDRDAEFARRAGSRAELLAGIDAARDAVDRGLALAPGELLGGPYPETLAGRQLSTEVFLTHLASHLAFHLGQLDYHRRIVTGDRAGAGAVSLAELPAFDETLA